VGRRGARRARTPTGSQSRTRPRRSASPRTGPSSRGTPAAGIAGDQEELIQLRPHPARRGPRLPERGQPGGELAAAGRRGRPVLAAAVRRRLHDGERDLRSRLSDPRAPGPRHRRGDYLGAPRSTARSCSPPAGGDFELRLGQGPVDRLPSPTTPKTVQLYFQESLTFLVLHGRSQRGAGSSPSPPLAPP